MQMRNNYRREDAFEQESDLDPTVRMHPGHSYSQRDGSSFRRQPTRNDPAPPVKKRAKDLIAIVAISLILVAAALLILAILMKPTDPAPSVEPDNGPIISAEPAVNPTPKLIPTPASEPDPTPTPAPDAGLSNAGTELRNIRYSPDGQITALSEKLDGEWVDWVYVYDASGGFLYRVRSIGSVESTLTSKFMPGTDTTYSETERVIHNCVGFTLEYQVTEVYAGDGLGERYLYLCCNESWTLQDIFSYPNYDKILVEVRFDAPVDFSAFCTPRVHPNDSRFMIRQELTNVLVADANDVCLADG
jgi:hypothetical protein